MSEQQNIEYKSSWHDNNLKWRHSFDDAQGFSRKVINNLLNI